jgi:hypothetical protein
MRHTRTALCEDVVIRLVSGLYQNFFPARFLSSECFVWCYLFELFVSRLLNVRVMYFYFNILTHICMHDNTTSSY